jgi:hypothetical protein
MERNHRHRAKAISDPEPYRSSVSVARENRCAHGGYSEVHSCCCGATKRVNRNQGYAEHGEWTRGGVR